MTEDQTRDGLPLKVMGVTALIIFSLFVITHSNLFPEEPTRLADQEDPEYQNTIVWLLESPNVDEFGNRCGASGKVIGFPTELSYDRDYSDYSLCKFTYDVVSLHEGVLP